MMRWEPGARERLQAAALELLATRGFEQTTAELAGLFFVSGPRVYWVRSRP
jgi:AcrR family transcriptional regulator